MKEVCDRIVRHERPDLVPRAMYLNDIIQSQFAELPKDTSIIQFGTACGYMLDTFKENGFTNITGVDKDPEMEKDWPKGIKFITSTARWGLKSLPKHDIVLLHRFPYILPDTAQTEELWQLFANSFKKYLIIIEEEVGENGGGRPVRYYRNYKSIFEPLGLKQIWEDSGKVQNVTCRIFTK